MSGRNKENLPNVLVFLTLKGNRFSRTLNFHHGLLRHGFSSYWVEVDPKRKARELRIVVDRFKAREAIYVVASPSHILVPYLKILTKEKIFLDAGWPLHDGVIQSRKMFGLFGWRFLFTFLIDFFSFHMSKKVYVESNTQILACRRRYWLSRKKLVALATGFDEDRFRNTHSRGDISDDKEEKLVLFRGGPQEEAGIQVLFTALRDFGLPVGVKFVVVSKIAHPKELDDTKLVILQDFQDDAVLWDLYQRSEIVLGQLSSHARLEKTLPHKFFEAGFFGKAYLTSNLGEIGKYVLSKNIMGFSPGSAEDLALKISDLLNSDVKRKLYADSLSALYKQEFSQEVLTERFLEGLK